MHRYANLLILFAFAVRSLLPVGLMLATVPDHSGTVQIVICTGHGPQNLTLDDKGVPLPAKAPAADKNTCPYAPVGAVAADHETASPLAYRALRLADVRDSDRDLPRHSETRSAIRARSPILADLNPRHLPMALRTCLAQCLAIQIRRKFANATLRAPRFRGASTSIKARRRCGVGLGTRNRRQSENSRGPRGGGRRDQAARRHRATGSARPRAGRSAEGQGQISDQARNRRSQTGECREAAGRRSDRRSGGRRGAAVVWRASVPGSSNRQSGNAVRRSRKRPWRIKRGRSGCRRRGHDPLRGRARILRRRHPRAKCPASR